MSVQKPRHDHGQRGAVQHLHGMAKPGPGHPEHSHGREARGEGQLNGAYAPQPGTYLGAACSQLAPGRMLSADPGTCSSHLRETPLSTRLPQIGPVTAQATPARARPGVHGAQPWHSAIMASLGGWARSAGPRTLRNSACLWARRILHGPEGSRQHLHILKLKQSKGKGNTVRSQD